MDIEVNEEDIDLQELPTLEEEIERVKNDIIEKRERQV